VPMLLTFPVLIALNSVFSQAIELRGAPFLLWIHDLSQHDPYYVTPLLMGVTLFWQTKMTPTTADPTQQQMMMFMPVMMTAIFLRLASGLAIYYLVGNLWAVGQQYFTNWLIGPAVPATAQPPGARKIKSAGGGKTSGAK
jgi:YidC/Oxa1 family membrane protein insertase